MNRMRYALIGCGKVAEKHLKAARAFPDQLTVTALVDNRPDAAGKLMTDIGLTTQQQSGIRVFTDYREMLQAVRPQVVAITTPSGSHYRIGMDAIETGAHVIIEKPLTLSIAESDEL